MTRLSTRRSPWLGLLIWSAVTLVGLAGWSELLTKPVSAYRRSGSLWKTLRDLFSGGIYDGWGEGVLFLLLTVVLVLILLFGIARFAARLNGYLDRSRVDISMLKTDILVRMLDDEMTRAQISRRQIFHANAPDVRAYHYGHTPQYGYIDEASFSIETKVAGIVITDELEVVPSAGGKGLEITEPFREPLPTSFMATYLSDRWVLALHNNLKMFRDVLATREVSFISIDEYNQENSRYELQFLRYPANEAVITIDFPQATAPDRADIKVLRIHENAATTIKPSYLPDGDRIIVSFTVFNAGNERVRIRWSNKRLKAHLASLKPAKRSLFPFGGGN